MANRQFQTLVTLWQQLDHDSTVKVEAIALKSQTIKTLTPEYLTKQFGGGLAAFASVSVIVIANEKIID
jgi:hypothetical protein